MRDLKKGPGNLKQAKITAFCLRPLTDLNETNVKGKKRKSEDENREFYRSPKKVALSLSPGSPGVLSPDLFVSSPVGNSQKVSKNGQFSGGNEKENNMKEDYGLFAFDDFENDPFLSPIKRKFPKKNVLGENGSLSQEETTGAGDVFMLEKSEINFENVTRCKIIKSIMVTKGRFEQILHVEDEKSEKKGICKLRGAWTASTFSPNDGVAIQTLQSEDGWVIDNKTGFIVLYPDIVISSTSLVSSMFCMRQGVLSNFYKEMDSDRNGRMLMGRLIHEFLQECLKSRSCSEDDVNRFTEKFLKSRNYLRDIYFSNKKFQDVKKEVDGFVPRIRNFLDVYVHKTFNSSGRNFSGTIDDVLDIEELIRSHNLGFQGRIDVTVKLKSGDSETVAPLELKTGKASFSNEHRSQLILYVMLMNEMGRKVESGLLLYLKEDIMEEIVPKRDEIRNLFLLRNHLIGFYQSFQKNNLPEPIRNMKACGMCPFLRVCTTYLKNEGHDRVQETHPLRSVELADVKLNHVDYFVRWNKMLWLEYGNVYDGESHKCDIEGLKLESVVEIGRGEFNHKFSMSLQPDHNTLAPGTFVYVANKKKNRTTTGRIIECTYSSCSVCLDKKLEDFSDTYEIVVFKSKFLSLYLSTLGWFLEERFEFLRQIIIDRKPPTFQEKLDKKTFKEKCLGYLTILNKEQQKGVLKSLLCNDYLLIKGPPGTGKTQTIVALIKTLLALDQSVLLASHTHSSVDNILLRLNDVEYLRLGSLKSVHRDIRPKCYATLIEQCSSVDDVGQLFNRKVIASTCTGIDADIINKRQFDVCIIDESSQVLQPEILKPLFCCKKFILVGDEDQLSPIVQNPEAKKLGMDKSMFEWLSHESATVSLRFQYRMNSVINSLANAITYNGLIKCANEKVAKATLKITNHDEYRASDEWIRDSLSEDLEKSVIFIDTSAFFKENNGKYSDEPRSSLLEANITAKLINSLIKFGIREESVGVIAPFCDQITLLKKRLTDEDFGKVELKTVDQYQGRDKDVILFSCGKENQANKEASSSELLNDKKRLTVALTRAKHKLIVIGDVLTVVKYEPFQKLIKSLNESQFIRLKNGEKNFFWEKYLS